jgi:hypothetical protein
MTDKTIDLDRHHGMAAQKATELRGLMAEVHANERALRLRQEELESHLLAAPAMNWQEVAEEGALSSECFRWYSGRTRSSTTEADCGRDR